MDDDVRLYVEKFEKYWQEVRIPTIRELKLSPENIAKIKKEFLKMEKEKFRLFPEVHIPKSNELEVYNRIRALQGVLNDALYKASENYRPQGNIQESLKNRNAEKFSIFISHIAENELIAEKLKEYLLSIFGDRIVVFISGDPDSISYSEDWFETILEAIRNCDLMIVLCTTDSVKRPWINFEIGAAKILKDKKIGPICFSGQSVGQLPSPLNYIRSQAIDITDEEKFKKYFENLIRAIAKHLDIEIEMMNVLESEFYLEIRMSGSRNVPPVLPKKF